MAASQSERTVSMPHLNWKSPAQLCSSSLDTEHEMDVQSRLELRTCVLTLEIQMPNPIVAVTTPDRTGFETPRPTIHILGPLVQSSRRALQRPFLKTCLGHITLLHVDSTRQSDLYTWSGQAKIAVKSSWSINVRDECCGGGDVVTGQQVFSLMDAF